LLPYAVLLLVPLMGAMSDPLKCIRVAAAQSFAALVPLLPLARNAPKPPGLDAELAARSEQDGHFLEQLLDNSKVRERVVCDL
jgi:TATA-binding protein-associated factor